MLALASIEDDKRDNTLTIVRGVLDLDKGKIADNVLTLSLAELIRTKADEKDAPKQAAAAPEPVKPAKATKTPGKRTKATEPVNTTTEQEKPVKTEIEEKLPWEKENKTVMVVTPEEFAERSKQAEKENLLNAEMEL